HAAQHGAKSEESTANDVEHSGSHGPRKRVGSRHSEASQASREDQPESQEPQEPQEPQRCFADAGVMTEDLPFVEVNTSSVETADLEAQTEHKAALVAAPLPLGRQASGESEEQTEESVKSEEEQPARQVEVKARQVEVKDAISQADADFIDQASGQTPHPPTQVLRAPSRNQSPEERSRSRGGGSNRSGGRRAQRRRRSAPARWNQICVAKQEPRSWDFE
ncbi:unnamed protein product, partial [Polarella glacialis]